MFYNFLKIQYLLGNIDRDKLLSFVPLRITQDQADEIISSKGA